MRQSFTFLSLTSYYTGLRVISEMGQMTIINVCMLEVENVLNEPKRKTVVLNVLNESKRTTVGGNIN